jgi:hypothetical protein
LLRSRVSGVFSLIRGKLLRSRVLENSFQQHELSLKYWMPAIKSTNTQSIYEDLSLSNSFKFLYIH